jgi:hypothetical protein
VAAISRRCLRKNVQPDAGTLYAQFIGVDFLVRRTMTTTPMTQAAPEPPATKGAITFIATLLAGSFGLAAGVALALLLVAFLWMP